MALIAPASSTVTHCGGSYHSQALLNPQGLIVRDKREPAVRLRKPVSSGILKSSDTHQPDKVNGYINSSLTIKYARGRIV